MSEEINNTEEVEAVSADAPENQERSPRGLDSREATQRKRNWENEGNLPDPTPQEGWVFRWIRTSLVGNTDNPNVSKRFREGWQPCRLEDHPELQIHMMDHKSEWASKGNIEIGGQLLCKMPKEVADERAQHFDKLARQQIEAVDNTFFKDQDSRMATKQVFERNSKTTFGRDS
tara:strand:+ start:2160 stop:2681 length:522 start_codon:yes stop_codon:yes gene_type:complete